MYPYQGSGQYGRPGDYGAFPGAPPGMAPPPGMAAPGTNAPLGMAQQETHQAGRGGFPPNFNPPANMPNINFSAPVIRLGTTGGKPDGAGMGGHSGRGDDRERGGRRAGLGSGPGGPDSGRDRERVLQIQPQTKEEIIKTIFVGGITEGCGGDEGLERILRAAGSLRRWFRATDAGDKPCKFGFAEYEDPESLRTAIEMLKDVEVPVKHRGVKKEGEKDDEIEEIEKSKLLIVPDENAATYIDQWEESQGGHDEEQKQMLLSYAKDALSAVLNDLDNPSAPAQKDPLVGLDQDGDVAMQDGTRIDAATGEVVTIPISIDDELSDIPAEMRETVAKEIAAFRDRSNRRDLERLKREEEVEQQEKSRMVNGRPGRLASPPPSAPSGPSGANGIPSGPKGAPSGPKGYGQQVPRDYQKGVAFVNGTQISGISAFEDEDTDASDSEIEQRREEKKSADLEKSYLDQERRWLNRERSRTAAIEREKARDADESTRHGKEKEAMAKQLREWDDDSEAARKAEEYYADRGMWIRNRASFRQREIALDDADRAAEQREKARDFQQRERVGAMADDFLSRQGEETARAYDRPRPRDRDRDRDEDRNGDEHQEQEQYQQRQAPREPARFQLKLGAAAQQKAQATAQAASKRTVADVEFLLEDEEETTVSSRRTLIPIQYDASITAASHMTDEERATAAKQLASEIPNDKEGLWTWDVKWDFVDDSVIEERLKPFVEKKIVEYLGVQEDMLVEVVVDALKARKKASDLVGELEDALDEEAEVLVKKLWRMVIFFSESEKRGLSA